MGGGLNIGPHTNDLRISEHHEMGDYLYEKCEEDEESDISDSEINQYKEAVHKLLKFKTYKIRGPNGELRCPFCVDVEKLEYHLLEHAIRVAEGSTEGGKQRANHFAMAKHLVIDLAADAEQSAEKMTTNLVLEVLDLLQSTYEEKRKLDLSNNQMAEKLRESEENYRGLVEKLKENEVALSNLEDMYRLSILKEMQSNEELEEVRLALIKKDLRNNEMAEKLREAEENYGGLVKRLESSLTSLAEKNSMLESELAQAKEYASSTVAKLREAEKTCLQIKQNLQSMEEKLSNIEVQNHVLCQKTLNVSPRSNWIVKPFLDESPTPSKFNASLMGGFSDSRKTKSGIEKHLGNLEILSHCIKDNLGFKDGKPMAACVIYKCLLHWHAFESERTAIFDFIIESINDVLKEGDENTTLPYWLSNTSTLLCLLQRILQSNGFLNAGSQRFAGLTGLNGRLAQVLHQSPSNEWDSIIKILDSQMRCLRGNHVPTFFIRKLTTQFAGTSCRHELNYIRQAAGFLVIHLKGRISLEEIRQNICPKLSMRQIYRITTMYWDDMYGTKSVSNEVISQMREILNKDSQNLSSSDSFLLHGDLSIPFSTEDVFMAIPAIDPQIQSSQSCFIEYVSAQLLLQNI